MAELNTPENKNCYTSFNESIKSYENNDIFSKQLCLRDVDRLCNCTDDNKKHCKDLNYKIKPPVKKKCVLAKGHTGRCSSKIDRLFNDNNDKIEKILNSSSTKIYSTPGNDDYVYKNRGPRIFPIALSKEDEKKIRNKKEKKKKCAIPLKDSSSPKLMAQAYLDWISLMLLVKRIDDLIKDKNNKTYKMYKEHGKYLIDYYKQFNVNLIDGNNNLICPIINKIITIDDYTVDRYNPKDNDIQVGHCEARSDNYVTIRGLNLLPMTRRGNLIIGEHNIKENIWIEELKNIVNSHK